ncbi:Nn.00g024100.m01.CDS01 [Neocucurbitaria sp. VM-36]
MQITIGVFAGLVAVVATSPASQTTKQAFSKASTKAISPRSTGADSDWHIGCDKNDHCYYYQKKVTPTANATIFSSRSKLHQSDCVACKDPKQCNACRFPFHGDNHFECTDPSTLGSLCVSMSTGQQHTVANSSSEAPVKTIGTAVSVLRRLVDSPYAAPPPSNGPNYNGPQNEEPGYQGPKHDGPEHDGPSPNGPSHEGPDYQGPKSHDPENHGPQHEDPDYESPSHDEPDNYEPGHESPEYEGPEHHGPEYNQPEHQGPDHDKPEHNGPDHDKPEHNGPDHGRPEHNGPKPGHPLSTGEPPYFEFNEEECKTCTKDDPCDRECNWQFKCGGKWTCFYNGPREVVELCYEKGEVCP